MESWLSGSSSTAESCPLQVLAKITGTTMATSTPHTASTYLILHHDLARFRGTSSTGRVGLLCLAIMLRINRLRVCSKTACYTNVNSDARTLRLLQTGDHQLSNRVEHAAPAVYFFVTSRPSDGLAPGLGYADVYRQQNVSTMN